MNNDHPSAQPFKPGLGLVPGNPFARPLVQLIAVTVLLMIGLMRVILFGDSTETRYNAGMFFIGVSLLFPLFILILLILSRNYARILQIPAGDYWLHWTYTPAQRQQWSQWLPGSSEDVYISPQGIYWTARKFRLRHFASGLTDVEIVRTIGEPDLLKFSYFARQYKNVSFIVFPSHNDYKEEFVPIPDGKEADAEALIKEIKARFLGVSSDWLNDQWWLVWWWVGSVVIALILILLLIVPLEFVKMDEEFDALATERAATDQAEMAMLEPEFAAYQPVIERELPNWIANREKYFRFLTPTEAGFKASDNISEVIVGYCEDGYAVLIVERIPTLKPFLGDRRAFGYTTSENRYTCLPPYWEIGALERLDNGWLYTTINTRNATLAPMLTEYATIFNPILTGTPPAP
jgi:hypothetical protein